MPKPSVDWAGQRVLVTGGRGFLGRHIVAALQARGADAVAVGRAEADLCDQGATEAMVADVRPHSVIHCAVEGGGIGWMRDHPVESGLNSTRMNVNILSASQQQGVALFVGVSSACVYPRLCPVPFAEADIWNGYPEPINGPYALSKRLMMDLGAACTRQYGLKTVFPILANLYGPHDHTDSRRAHVVADLMIRCAAQPDELVVWGTGGASREFLFVEDAAEGILAAAAGPAGAINIGSGVEVSILDLARAVLVAWGLSVPIRLDRSKPDGQPRKCLSVERAAAVLGWRAPTGLADGLAVTAGWYGGVLDGGDSRPSKSRGGDKVVASKSPLTLARENLQLVDVRAADVDQISDKLIGPVLEWLGYEIRDEGHCRMNVELHPFLAPALWAAGTDGHVEVLVWHQSPMLWTDSKILLFAIQDAIRTPQWRGLKWVAVTDGDKWEVYSASSEPKERPTI
ncbi:MAG: GDP-L-fucose synthase, partial [Myxococcota bacterium]